MENIIKQRIDEMKNTKFPNGFSNGIDGFLEAVSFFNEQAHVVHEDYTEKNDIFLFSRNILTRFCWFRDTDG